MACPPFFIFINAYIYCMKVEIHRINDAVHLEATNEQGIKVQMDGSPEIGGKDLGARPMQMILMGLGGCTSMDVLSILHKMRENVEDYHVIVDGERDTNQIPSVFNKIHIHYTLKGNLSTTNVEKAIKLSMEKYCSVSKMLEKTAEITYTYTITN